MSSLLNIGARALLANQTALSTTGHNISNANTAGYSRQTAVMQQVPGRYTGSGYIGGGVEVSSIERAHNEFLTRQTALAQSVSAMDSTRSDRLALLEDILKGGASGLGAAVNDMLNAFSDVASAPTDVTARNVVIARADEMTARFRDADARLSDLQQGVNAALGEAVKTVNGLATQIAALNEQMARVWGPGQSPNDLLDQRDQLLRELNQQVQATTVAADDGSMSVFVGSHALVLAGNVAKLSLEGDAGGTSRLAIGRGSLASEVHESSLGGGVIAGLLRFQNGDLAEARNGLGRMALTMATEINAQHRLGIDLNRQAGGDFFQPIAVPNAIAAAGNTGSAVVAAAVTDASALVASSYNLAFGAGGSLDITRLSDGKSTHLAGPTPVQIDGLTIDELAGAAAVGDSFLLEPFATAAGRMSMALTSPIELAMANPVEARIGTGNSGSAAIRSLAAVAPDPNLTATVTLTFSAAGSFDVVGAGTGNPTGQPYVAGQPISFNGWTVTLAGTPKPGDTVTIQAATSAYGSFNAGNAQTLLALRDKALFDGAPLSDGYAGLMGQIGAHAQGAKYAADISSSIASNLETERSNVAGVNLDEEAAKLLQYQQAYQASAKMIQIAQNVFDSLLRSMN
ncbi:MAG: flagellar hook-associated protein FlgK [Burkholderiales bacterium]